MLGPPVERLQPTLVELLALERDIQQHLRTLRGRTADHLAADALLAELEALTRTHIEALRARLDGTPTEDSGHSNPTPHPARAPSAAGLAEQHPLSAALRDAYAAIQPAIIGYGAIESIAHRVRDSWVMADEGTTSHIARGHQQEYIAIGGRLVTLMHDVVLEELDAAGVACGCTCPSCGVGVCMCAAAPRAVFAQATATARPYVAEHGVEVPAPRPGSAAAVAGLRRGDVVTAVDGTPIDALTLMQRLILDHQPGDLMQFTVRRAGGEVTIPVEHRREGVDINEDECVLPAGQVFYLDQARDVLQRLRKRANGNGNGAGSGLAGLASLSPRQLQVLRLVSLGATNPIIAEELEITRATVAQHIRNVLNKLGVANRTEATRVATEQGLLISA